ncbi:MAG: nuclear transport factor 2 family protein [Cytophagaceae bacterium]|nr:nuclear transport factor 2 family protein [Gemmatimonadaceae bacterium]
MQSLAIGGFMLVVMAFPVGRIEAQSAPADTSGRARVVAGYCAAWNEPDPTRRANLLRVVWDTEGEYSDPTPANLKGRDALSGHIDGFLKQFAGGSIRCSAPQFHHQSGRFTWEIFAANGSSVVAGMDYAEFAPDGRLRRIVGFFGPLPLVNK